MSETAKKSGWGVSEEFRLLPLDEMCDRICNKIRLEPYGHAINGSARRNRSHISTMTSSADNHRALFAGFAQLPYKRRTVRML